MTKKIRYFSAILTLGLLAFLSLSAQLPLAGSQPELTPGPKSKAVSLSLEAQAGKSDGILLLGMLLFVLIVVPIVIRYRDIHKPR